MIRITFVCTGLIKMYTFKIYIIAYCFEIAIIEIQHLRHSTKCSYR